MKLPRWALWLTRLAWGLLIIDLILVVIVPADTDFRSVVLTLLYLGFLLFSLVIAATWLMLVYRRFFRTLPGWIIAILVLGLSGYVVQGVKPTNPMISLLFSLHFLLSAWLVGIATAILLWYRDIGLGTLALATTLSVWLPVFAWRFQGNLIELWLSSLHDPNAPMPLWWLNSLCCALGWIIPIGIVSFLGHTFRLVIRELK